MREVEQHLCKAVESMDVIRAQHGTWRLDGVLTHEVEAGEAARNLLALHLCQEDRNNEAMAHLRVLQYRYRLSRHILAYSERLEAGCLAESDLYVQALDNALDERLLTGMQTLFSAEGSFWSEHDYASPHTGYFSYLHEVMPAETVYDKFLDQVIHSIYKLAQQYFPSSSRARCVPSIYCVF
jgi:hypothetical protein